MFAPEVSMFATEVSACLKEISTSQNTFKINRRDEIKTSQGI